jgi:hypothetical protein
MPDASPWRLASSRPGQTRDGGREGVHVPFEDGEGGDATLLAAALQVLDDLLHVPDEQVQRVEQLLLRASRAQAGIPSSTRNGRPSGTLSGLISVRVNPAPANRTRNSPSVR